MDDAEQVSGRHRGEILGPCRVVEVPGAGREAGTQVVRSVGACPVHTDQVGGPPPAYLTRRRMTLAAGLPTERETASVAGIARCVGHSDAFAFSAAAFKRIRGVSPSGFRRTGTVVSATPLRRPERR
ncbi:hypothetical protein ACIQ7D_05205 [Streptomyces sp. NPDC096310]|uniref:hypothetical protein n=1 Tax=Streptomyces sp. NPDC096310 TaxID=3366082 RepID=UPI00382558DE